MNGFADGDFEGALLGSLEGLVDGGFEGMTGAQVFSFFLFYFEHVQNFLSLFFLFPKA